MAKLRQTPQSRGLHFHHPTISKRHAIAETSINGGFLQLEGAGTPGN
jgi:hypothetical protein